MSDDVSKILGLARFEESLYRDIDLNRLAVFGIALLRDMGIAFTMERLSVVLFRMFPAKYAMTEFESYPDQLRTQRAVLQLRPKYRNWAEGSVRQGNVTLTQDGLHALEQVRELLERDVSQIGEEQGKRVVVRPRDVSEKWMVMVETSTLFSKFREDIRDEDLVWDFYDLLRVSEGTERATVRKNLSRLEDYAEAVGREDVIEFLRWVRREFRAYL